MKLKNEYRSLNESVNSALNSFKNIEKNYETVHNKMFEIYSLCESHVSEIQELEKEENNAKIRIDIYESLESITSKLNNPSLNIEDEYFHDIIKKTDDCIMFIMKEVNIFDNFYFYTFIKYIYYQYSLHLLKTLRFY